MNVLFLRLLSARSFLSSPCTAWVCLLAVTLLSSSSVLQAQTNVQWGNVTGSPSPWYHENFNWVGGIAPNSDDVAVFDKIATYEVWWNSTTASLTPSVGGVQVSGGDVTFFANDGTATRYLFTINGSNSRSDFSISGSSTSMTMGGMHMRSLGGGQILDGASLTIDGTPSQGSKLTVEGSIGFDVSGNLMIQQGGVFDNSAGKIGLSGSPGIATVRNSGSQWNNSGSLNVGAGVGGVGTLNVELGGTVSSLTGSIGSNTGSIGVANISGIGSQWNIVGQSTVGHGGNGTLNVEAGGVVNTTTSYLGFFADSVGGVNVTGAGSQLNHSDDLWVGREGVGSLNIADGGLVSNSIGYIAAHQNSTASSGVSVTGEFSHWHNTQSLYIGGDETTNGAAGSLFIDSDGTVNVGNDVWVDSLDDLIVSSFSQDAVLWVSSGSSVVVEGRTIIGKRAEAAGAVTVTGNGTQVDLANSLVVGSGGDGTLSVTDGGVINSDFSTIGKGTLSTGIATVTGAQSQWNDSGWLTVGQSGNGTLNVTDGAFVSSENGRIASESDSSGVVTVTGAGSQWNMSDATLFVGIHGDAALNVEDGGVVNNGLGYVSERGGTSNVLVTGSGSQWNNFGGLAIGGSLTYDGGVGTLNISNTGKVNVGSDLYTFYADTALTVSDSGSNGVLWVRNGSTIENAGFARIGLITGSSGTATVTGEGSQWNNLGGLDVGHLGVGTLNIQAGGRVSNSSGYVGFRPDSFGYVTVTGAGSQWNNTDRLYVGYEGVGSLSVEAGGVVTNTQGYVGYYDNGFTSTATVTGSGSQWNSTGDLWVAAFGGAGTLSVESGGVVTNTSGYIGNGTGASGSATVMGSGSQWNNSSNLTVGVGGVGTLNIELGGTVSSLIGSIGSNTGSTGVANISGIGSQWNNSNDLKVGVGGVGTLNIELGGTVSGFRGYIASNPGSTGVANISGIGSQWNNSNDLNVGYSGTGTLNVEAGGLVSSVDGRIGYRTGSTGLATVTGSGSQWNNSGDLYVGSTGAGTLNVQAGGFVSNINGEIGRLSDSTGVVTVTGSGSHWANAGNLSIGGTATESGGAGTLNINDGGLVTVGGTTHIWILDTGAGVVLEGGRFEFGTTTLAEFETIHAISGSMAGDVVHTGYTDVASLTAFRNPGVNLSEVRVANAGVLYGNAALDVGLLNQSSGQVETMAGDRLRFAGVGSINAGEINNFGGQIRFAETLTNESGALLGGRGQFFAEGGWTNDGVIAMSGGFADVHGDLVNGAEGIIAIGGGSTTTFYDDVTMDAENLNMEIASDSYAVFFGSYNGGSNGLGTLQAFGDLRPGNSPASVSFGGNLELGSNTVTHIELGGELIGEFDQLLIAGDFLTDGDLEVSLINGFSLDFNQEFLIGDIGGTRFGGFDGLSEGDRVGNFGGFDLFISYQAGTGNDISLFTSVPEPGTAAFLACCAVGWTLRRRRRRLSV